jgi:hypothetical protein
VRHRQLVRTGLTTGLTVGLAAVLLTGCGSGAATDGGASSPTTAAGASGRTGPEVAADAAAALEQAGAVRVTGSVGAGDEAQTVDLLLQGEDATGTVSTGGRTVQLLTVAGTSYVQASADFWSGSGAPAETAALLDGAWVVVPGEEAGSLGELSLAGLVQELRSPRDGAVADEVGTGRVDGQDALVVTQADGSTLYVADGDPAYPLRIEGTGGHTGEDTGALELGEFGRTREITAPEQPLDLSGLGA